MICLSVLSCTSATVMDMKSFRKSVVTKISTNFTTTLTIMSILNVEETKDLINYLVVH